MKIVLTCGHVHSGLELVHDHLVANGLAQARPSKQHGLSPSELNDRLFKAHDISGADFVRNEQLFPGKVGEELAVDLFLGNPLSESWGWADSKSVCLLEFWKMVDPQVRFVLVYIAPENAVARMLEIYPVTREGIEQCMASWVATNAEMLRFYYRNTDRCLLVNCMSTYQNASPLCSKVFSAFGMNIEKSSWVYAICKDHSSHIACCLAKGLVEEYVDAIALFRELESSADVESSPPSEAEVGRLLAWEEYSMLNSTIRRTTKERDEMEKREFLIRRDCDALSQTLAKLTKEHTKAMATLEQNKMSQDSLLAEMTEMRSSATQLAREDELLLGQIQQVQDELEQHLLHEQEIKQQLMAQSEKVTWRDSQPAKIVFDLRREIDGENWYPAEHDGRWAGPGTISTIKVPALHSGRYAVLFDIVDAMEPKILAEMLVSLNGSLLHVSEYENRYPTSIYAEFSTENILAQPFWEFQFKFSKLISPADSGSDDHRNLAIRLRSLKLNWLE